MIFIKIFMNTIIILHIIPCKLKFKGCPPIFPDIFAIETVTFSPWIKLTIVLSSIHYHCFDCIKSLNSNKLLNELWNFFWSNALDLTFRSLKIIFLNVDLSSMGFLTCNITAREFSVPKLLKCMSLEAFKYMWLLKYCVLIWRTKRNRYSHVHNGNGISQDYTPLVWIVKSHKHMGFGTFEVIKELISWTCHYK